VVGAGFGSGVVAFLVFLVWQPSAVVPLALDAAWRPPCLVVSVEAAGSGASPPLEGLAFWLLVASAALAPPVLRRVVLP
jgi:hypothetical protein